MTKVFCNRCNKEIPVLEESTIHFKSACDTKIKHHRMGNGLDYPQIIQNYALGNDEFGIDLCFDCAVKFKRVFDLFMEKK